MEYFRRSIILTRTPSCRSGNGVQVSALAASSEPERHALRRQLFPLRHPPRDDVSTLAAPRPRGRPLEVAVLHALRRTRRDVGQLGPVQGEPLFWSPAGASAARTARACQICSKDGYEIRKIEVFRDGRLEYADEHREAGATILSEEPVGTVEKIAAQEEFRPQVISEQVFEEAWARARAAQEE